MYKHLHLLFLHNVEDTTRIVSFLLFFFFLMKRCKATVWYRDEIQNKIKEHNSGGGEPKIKGLSLTHQTELPVPDAQGWIYSFDQPNYCTKTCHWLAQITPRSKFDLKTSLYNHKLLSQSVTDHYTHPWPFHLFATILRSLSSSEWVLISLQLY